jgi:DNA repair protein RadC
MVHCKLTFDGLMSALFDHIREKDREVIECVFCGPEGQEAGRLVHEGASADYVAPPLRELVRAALSADAVMAVIAHNHPGGTPHPSDADYAFTRRLADLFAALDIRLHDHLILTVRTTFSFREQGLL